MRKRFTVLVLCFVFAILVSSCSSSATKNSDTILPEVEQRATEAMAGSNEAASIADTGDVTGTNEHTVAPATAIIDPGNISDVNKKIIYTVFMSLETADAAKAIEAITDEAVKIGGYVSNSTFEQNDNVKYGSITVRIPPESLKDFSDKVSENGKILSSNMSSEDVSAQYVDVEARLKNAQAQEAQLLAIMAQAVKIEDILYVRSELNTVQEEIEVLKGQLRYLDNLVGFSTVTITVSEPLPAPEIPEEDPNKGALPVWTPEFIQANMQKSFNNSLAVVSMIFGALLTVLSFLFVPLLMIAAIVIPIVAIVRFRRKNKAKKSSKS